VAFGRSGKPFPMEVYVIKVTLLGTSPPVWRRLLVHRDITLRNLHKTLQTAMGWTNSHLHQFVFKRQKYSDRKHGLGAGIIDENRTRLGDVICTPGTRLLYEYDFGDGWQHELLLEEVLLGDESFRQVCVAGGRNCPPEDCGGPHGFSELLKVLQNATHPEHDDIREWVGEDFAPEYFAVDEINRKLRRRKH
jgi:Plasmid pRiA4b ORF-3-like protein